MKIKWYIATFRDMATNKWRDVNIQADSLREARYKASTYHKGTFETLERIKFDKDYREINITCKGLYKENRANKDYLGSILNELAIVYHEAAMHNEQRGCFAIARDYNNKSEQLTKICEGLGIYEE